MSDYIEREAAIAEIEKWYDMYPDSDAAREALSLTKRAIRKIHAADVRPVVRGEWYNGDRNEGAQKTKLNQDGTVTDTAYCSVCGDWLGASDEYAVRGRFCPNCGADMRGGKSNGET
ncbi:MAG: hypothetical protein IIV93_00705 [Clostridia bacterium]|nr:hypothetical protein [Clostridia bacterium]